MESRIMESRTMKNRFRGHGTAGSGQEDLDSERNGYGERDCALKTELTEEAKVIEETEMEGQLVAKVSKQHTGEEAVGHVFVPSGSAGLSGQIWTVLLFLGKWKYF